jgi:hypothetical protein
VGITIAQVDHLVLAARAERDGRWAVSGREFAPTIERPVPDARRSGCRRYRRNADQDGQRHNPVPRGGVISVDQVAVSSVAMIASTSATLNERARLMPGNLTGCSTPITHIRSSCDMRMFSPPSPIWRSNTQA